MKTDPISFKILSAVIIAGVILALVGPGLFPPSHVASAVGREMTVRE